MYTQYYLDDKEWGLLENLCCPKGYAGHGVLMIGAS